MRKGSITIFSLLSLVLVAACLFTLLEGARYKEIKRLAELQTELSVESVFANYNSYLWEEYQLLASDKWGMEETLIANGNARYDAEESGINMLQFQVEDVEVEAYTLLTDGQGASYINVVSSYMEKNLLFEIAKDIYNQYEVVKQLKEQSTLDTSVIEEAIQKIKEVESEEGEDAVSVGTSGTYVEEGVNLVTDEKNELETMKRILDMGILELVVEDTSQLSSAEIDFSNAVSERVLSQGENNVVAENEWINKIYLQQYLLTYLSNYTNKREQGALAYEIEYLVGKQSADIENLKAVVTQIMGLREAVNYLYLLSNPQKVEEAGVMAIAIAGTSGNPVLIELVKTALLAAWAYAESVLDMRALLAGKKISLLKNDDLWTLDLEDITTITNGYAMAKESELGLDYKNYLGILLLFQNQESLALHGMNIQEITIQKKYNVPEFRMDELMIQAQVKMSYVYNPIFPMVTKTFSRWNYVIETNAGFKY